MKENDIKAIDRVLYYSNLILKYKKLISELRQAKVTASGIPVRLPSEPSIKMLMEECNRRITECDHQARMFLRAVLEGRDFGYGDFNHFNNEELKRGYVLLREHGVQLPQEHSTHVLFIQDYKHIKRGTFLVYRHAIKIIDPTYKEKRKRINHNNQNQ